MVYWALLVLLLALRFKFISSLAFTPEHIGIKQFSSFGFIACRYINKMPLDRIDYQVGNNLAT